ncbi:MAG TPA: hypothetical protein VFV33_06485, partial [Gemmatimonadaceae bacterium]|nr:hypothetical protein [Gemmatimonadaceae bacterium]
MPRYAAFVLEAPQTGAYAGSPASIVAKLQLSRGTAYSGVGSASYNVTYEDGRDAGAGALTAGAEGRFTGSWVPPEQGTFKIAAHNATSALTSETVTFNVDLTAPVFHVVAPAPARRVGGATESNENDPDLAGAWKRDEVATVVVSAMEAIQGDSVILKVWGTTDGGVPANPASSFSVTPGTHAACNGRPYCGVVAVDLADIDMPIYRGRLA